MKFHFICDEKNEKYIKLIESIKKYLQDSKSKVEIGAEKGYKEDIYVFLSDNDDELKLLYEKSKKPKKVMIITENLKVEYIMLCTDISKKYML